MPIFVGAISVMVTAVIVPDTMLAWGSILVASSLGSGCIAVAVARSQLREGWADAGENMRGPYGLASLVFVGLALAARSRLVQPGVFVESSPYLATAVIVMTAFAESALGAFVVSVVLGTQSRR